MTKLLYEFQPFSHSGPGSRHFIVSLRTPDNFGNRGYRDNMCRSIEFVAYWQKVQNPKIFGGRSVAGFVTLETIPCLKRFSAFHMRSRRKVVLRLRERFHSSIDMWPRGGTENRPDRALMFDPLAPCDMILNRWIYHGGSMVRMDHACQRFQGLSVEQIGCAIFSLAIGFVERNRQLRLKRHDDRDICPRARSKSRVR